jgi:hypothetical protein
MKPLDAVNTLQLVDFMKITENYMGEKHMMHAAL